jgi:hypothetical protein
MHTAATITFLTMRGAMAIAQGAPESISVVSLRDAIDASRIRRDQELRSPTSRG